MYRDRWYHSIVGCLSNLVNKEAPEHVLQYVRASYDQGISFSVTTLAQVKGGKLTHGSPNSR